MTTGVHRRHPCHHHASNEPRFLCSFSLQSSRCRVRWGLWSQCCDCPHTTDGETEAQERALGVSLTGRRVERPSSDSGLGPANSRLLPAAHVAPRLRPHVRGTYCAPGRGEAGVLLLGRMGWCSEPGHRNRETLPAPLVQSAERQAREGAGGASLAVCLLRLLQAEELTGGEL